MEAHQHFAPMPTTLFEPLHPVQKAAFQKMSLDDKLAMVNGLICFARELKLSHLRVEHSDWTEEQIQREVARIFCMLLPDLYQSFIKPIHQAGISYMVTGSVASIAYGEPRMTLDVDMVVFLKRGDAAQFQKIFPENNYYVPGEDVLLNESMREVRGHWNVIDHKTGLKADFYPVGRDSLHIFFWPRRVLTHSKEGELWLAPPEYVILRKLQYFAEGASDKHLRDIDRMLEISPEKIDLELLMAKIREYGLQDGWRKIRP
ncbi:MAG: nucleotidyltransferase family protein [Blastochloris sp.]|nr:nucleotidyltransferase family protein [Blastochloris sp.]